MTWGSSIGRNYGGRSGGDSFRTSNSLVADFFSTTSAVPPPPFRCSLASRIAAVKPTPLVADLAVLGRDLRSGGWGSTEPAACHLPSPDHSGGRKPLVPGEDDEEEQAWRGGPAVPGDIHPVVSMRDCRMHLWKKDRSAQACTFVLDSCNSKGKNLRREKCLRWLMHVLSIMISTHRKPRMYVVSGCFGVSLDC